MAIDLDVHGNTKPLEAAVQAAVNRIRRQPIKITVDDKGATQPLGNMKRGADEFTKSMEAANARILAFGASMAIINGVANAFKGMVKNLVEVEKSLADINVVMGLSAQNLDKFSDGLFKVAKETGAAFKVAADAATEYARQGLGVEESLKRTRDALVLTRLTGMDSAEAVKSLTAAMNTYGTQIKDTTQLVSKFAAVDVKFAVSAQDFADAISRTGQSAKSAGVSIDELVGIVTSAQQQTARGGAVIGNALKTIFTKTGKTDTLNQLENLGVAVRDLEGNTLGAKRILSDLANTFDTLSAAQKAQITQTMGGLFHINILKAVLSDAAKQNGIMAEATRISAGATDEAIQKNEELRKTMSAVATETGLAIKQVSAQIGEIAIAPGMEKILNSVKSLAEGLSNVLGDGETTGSSFATGFLKGIGNVITGPGLVVLAGVFFKLFGQALKFTKESLTSLVGVTTEKQKQKAIQTSLVALFGQNAALNKEMLRTDIGRTEKEKIILGLLKAQVVEANALNRLTAGMAGTLYRKGYGANLTPVGKKASGHIPNFAHPERAQAAQGGYAAGSIRSMNMPGEGPVIYNSAETVKNFAGFKQPAIMPPQSSKAGKNYQQAFGDIHGFDPYAAGGYIPNYAKTYNADSKMVLFAASAQDGGGYAGPDRKKNIIYINPSASAGSGDKKFSATKKTGMKAVNVPYFTIGVNDEARAKNDPKIKNKIEGDLISQARNTAKGLVDQMFGMDSRGQSLAEAQVKKSDVSVTAGHLFEKIIMAVEKSVGAEAYDPDPPGNALLDIPRRGRDRLWQLFGAGTLGGLGAEAKIALGSGGGDAKHLKSAAEKFYKIDEVGKPEDMALKRAKAFAPAGKLNLSLTSDLQAQKMQEELRAPNVKKTYSIFDKLSDAKKFDLLSRYKSYGHIPNFAAMTISRLGGLGKSKFGLAAVINSNPYFAQLLRRYGHWNRFPPQEKAKLNKFLLKQGFTNRALQGYGLASMHSKSIGEGIGNIAAASGYIPNFANPLSDAIGREKAAGVPVSQIRVGSHGALMSKGNPLGLGVTNTHDEPNGLRDVFGANGFVPNYAEGFTRGDVNISGRNFSAQDKLVKKLNLRLKAYIEKFKAGEINQKQLNDGIARLSRRTKDQAATTERVTRASNKSIGYIGKLNAQRRKYQNMLSRGSAAFNKTGAGKMLGSTGGQMGIMMGLPMAAGFVRGDDPTNQLRSAAGGFMEGAGTGAAMGMMFGPLGMAIGGAVGGLYGLVDGLSEAEEAARKKAKAEIENSRGMGSSLASVFSKFPEIKQNLKEFRGQYNKIEALRAEQAGIGSWQTNVIDMESGETETKYVKDPKAQARARAYRKIMSNMVESEFEGALKTLPEDYQFSATAATPGKTFTGTGKQYIEELEKVSDPRKKTAMYESFIETQKAEEAQQKKLNQEQARGIIIQLNLQKAQIQAQRNAADAQLDIKSKYLQQSNMLDMQEKLMGGLMTEQQKAQLKYNKSINKAAEAFDQAEATANATLKTGILQQVGASQNLQQELKKALSAEGEGAALVQDISNKVAGMSADQLINTLETIKQKNKGNADIQQAINLLMETELQKRQNSVDLAQRQKDIAEGQASSELKINSILADRKQLLEDMTDRMKEFKDKSDFLTQKGALDKRISAAQRQGTGYISADRQLQIQRSEMEKYTIPQLKREGIGGKTGILSTAAGKLNIGGFSAEEEAQILAMGGNADISEIVKAKKAREFEEANRGGKMQQLGTRIRNIDERILPNLGRDDPQRKNAIAQREKLQEQLNNLNLLQEQSLGKNKEINKEIEKANTALERQNVINEKNVEAVKEEQAARERMRQRMTGPGALGNGIRDAQGEMLESVKTFDYQLGDVVTNNFRDGLAEAMQVALSGAEDLDDALRGIATNFLQAIQNAFLQNAANAIVGSIPMPGGKSRGGSIRSYSRGGGVPAMVSNGEYVMGRDAVNKYGGAFMHGMNAGGNVPGFSNGGKLADKLVNVNVQRKKVHVPGGAAKGSALAAGFGGAEGYKSGRAYQGKAMSGFFYSQSENVGLGEDSQKMSEIVQERRQKEEEEYQKAMEKHQKKQQLVQAAVGAAISAGISYGMSGGFGGGKDPFSDTSLSLEEAAMKADAMKNPANYSIEQLDSMGLSTTWRKTLNYAGNAGQSLRSFLGFKPKTYGGKIARYANGGHIAGKSGIDQIPAMLSEGEYVIRASSARQIGRPMLDRINAGKFNDGGAVSEIAGSSETGSSGGNTNNINISINMERGSASQKQQTDQTSTGQNPADNSKDQESSAALADRIKKQVVAIIAEEQRPGGLLSD